MIPRIRDIQAINRGAWRHPWKLGVFWNEGFRQWQCSVEPGLVNGLEATIDVKGEDVPLGDRPWMGLSAWRAIGTDATPSQISTSAGGNVSYGFEAVPKFFSYRGVGPPPSTRFDLTTGRQIRSGAPFDPAPSRLLRAVDIVLNIDRFGMATQWDTSTLGSATFSVTYVIPPGARKAAYISQTGKFQAAAPEDALAQIRGDYSSGTQDRLQIGTVWLVSPPGSDGTIDGSWAAYVSHRLFWNLHHGVNQLVPIAPEPITLHSGLAGGVGDLLNDLFLGQVNDGNNVAWEFLIQTRVSGLFWTA